MDSTEPEVLAEEADLEVPENLAVVLAEYMRKEGKISRRKYRSALKKRYLAVIKGLRFLPVTERARTLKCIFRQALQKTAVCASEREKTYRKGTMERTGDLLDQKLVP